MGSSDAQPSIALVGSSGFGAAMIAPTLAEGKCRFAGVLGSTSSGSAALAEKFGVKAFRTLDEMLQDSTVDVVWVSAKDGLHAPMGSAIIRAGKHLLLEKPLTRTLEEAHALVAIAEAHPKSVCRVGFHQRHRPAYQQLRAGVEAGRIGRVRHIRLQFFIAPFPPGAIESTWRASRTETGGTWIMKEFGAHLLDLLLWISGVPAEVVGAVRTTQMFDIETDDTASILLRLDGGAIATVEVSAAIPSMKDSVHIFGDMGCAYADDIFFGAGTIRWNGDGPVAFQEADMRTPYFAEIEDFSRAIAGERGLSADMRDGLAVQELIEAGYRASGGE